MKTVLDSFFSEGFDDPVLFLIKNDVIKSNYNLTVLGKQVKYSPEPNDYYSKLIISFEQLTIADTISTVTVYSKRAGIIGNFVLKKKNGKWLIKSYNKIFT